MSSHTASHFSIVDQVAGAVVRSATSHSVGALMHGRGPVGVILIAAALIGCVWLVRRVFRAHA
jgi:hypothetical protein